MYIYEMSIYNGKINTIKLNIIEETEDQYKCKFKNIFNIPHTKFVNKDSLNIVMLDGHVCCTDYNSGIDSLVAYYKKEIEELQSTEKYYKDSISILLNNRKQKY